MTQYTTGELAKLCGTTVRTVQYYDSKDLLKPSELTDGGRRLYSDTDLERLRVICFLKDLGFSLKDIFALMHEPDTESTLRFLLESQQRKLTRRIEADQAALAKTRELQQSIAYFHSLTPETFGVITDIMDSKKRLRNVRIAMVLVGLVMDASWIVPLVYGIIAGNWWPFAIGAAIAIMMGVLISRYYTTHTAYVCPEDQTIFRPPLMQNLFAAHTPSMRKLTCPTCAFKGYCLEVYAPASKPVREDGYLIWNKGILPDCDSQSDGEAVTPHE